MKKKSNKHMSFSTSRKILSLTAHGAREFFLKAENYFNGDVPSYFEFGSLLQALDNAFAAGKPDMKTLIKRASGASAVNYVLHLNKDGHYASRPLQFIHPVLYVALVDEMTQESNWETILNRLQSRADKDGIKCTSVSVAETRWDSYQAEQILVWWSDFEQESIALALEYPHVFITDLSDCYGSIRSYDIPRALHGRGAVRAPSFTSGKFGDRIDLLLRAMNHGQVGKLPQGSTLMDVLAELVLSELDEELRKRIKKNNVSGFRILRYRDDYRIFVKNESEGRMILKLLAETARGFGLKLNSGKTLASNDVISASIKKDKMDWMAQSTIFKDAQPSKILSIEKQLLLIYRHGLLYPNAGSLLLPLSIVHRQIDSRKTSPFKPEALIAIAAEIAIRNPRACKPCIAIIAKLLQSIHGTDREAVCISLLQKIKTIPNSSYFEIWFQRVLSPLGIAGDYTEPLCMLVAGTTARLPLNLAARGGTGRILAEGAGNGRIEGERTAGGIRRGNGTDEARNQLFAIIPGQVQSFARPMH